VEIIPDTRQIIILLGTGWSIVVQPKINDGSGDPFQCVYEYDGTSQQWAPASANGSDCCGSPPASIQPQADQDETVLVPFPEYAIEILPRQREVVVYLGPFWSVQTKPLP
jgi:hypothetical protein